MWKRSQSACTICWGDDEHLQPLSSAEYNTATARARTAKQWNDFNADPIANELYPNLRWLPSRSANPREEHQAFYWLVLPKTDDFWKQNQPGNLWNCKCDWEETDAPIDTKELKADDLAKARKEGGGIHANGLEGNPAVTGEIFTQGCTYFKQAGKKGTEVVEEFFRPIKEHHNEYMDLSKNPDYNEVKFDWSTGGMKATHKDHNFDKDKGIYEENVRDTGYKNGHAVTLESEKGKGIGENYTEGLWNGSKFELASCESPSNNNNIVRGLKHCASKSETETAVLYFPKGDFVEKDVLRAIKRYYGLKSTLGDGFKDFVAIYAVCEGQVYQMK